MIYERIGRVTKGLGGLFEVRSTEGERVERYTCRAKGNLKRDDEKLIIGDKVRLTVDDETPDGVVISEVLERKNSLIRPPIANLDLLFVVFSAVKPAPVLETVDKLISIAIHNGITPCVVVTKSELDSDRALELANIYRSVGIDTFVTSSREGVGLAEVSIYIKEELSGGGLAAFAGASGVGKSTLINTLFPGMELATSEISHKIERGKHTTRHVEIFDIEGTDGFLADTPGFSLIDFERFDFFALEDLPLTFPELSAYSGECRYSDCSHVGESSSECAVARAAKEGKIPPSRLESYRSIYTILKNKNRFK